MFRWFGLVGLRRKTIAVVEREYGRPLDVAGGADTQLFNQTTRLARDFGGNEYDAAAVFMATDSAIRLRQGREVSVGLLDLFEITNQRLPLMRQPAIVNEAMERAMTAVDQ